MFDLDDIDLDGPAKPADKPNPSPVDLDLGDIEDVVAAVPSPTKPEPLPSTVKTAPNTEAIAAEKPPRDMRLIGGIVVAVVVLVAGATLILHHKPTPTQPVSTVSAPQAAVAKPVVVPKSAASAPVAAPVIASVPVAAPAVAVAPAPTVTKPKPAPKPRRHPDAATLEGLRLLQ